MDIRDRIIDAAKKVYAQHGFRGATTRLIAIEAGVNEVTLFRTFGSKAALFEALMQSHVAQSPIPELPDDPRFARNEDRTANRDQLRPLLVERLQTRPKMEWFRELTAAGVPCGPINTIDQGVAFADEVGLDPVVVVGKGDEAIPSVRHPIRFSATPASYRLPPPSLDQHGEEIRRWLAEPEAEA